LESWRFSGEMVLAVRHHRSPALAGEAAPMAALLQLAQWHARAVEAETQSRPQPEKPDSSVIATAGLETKDFGSHLPVVQQRFLEHKSTVGGS
ncbi:MAG: hypothetical protein ACREIA_10675, partial [Opitutaceae bacterium]